MISPPPWPTLGCIATILFAKSLARVCPSEHLSALLKVKNLVGILSWVENLAEELLLGYRIGDSACTDGSTFSCMLVVQVAAQTCQDAHIPAVTIALKKNRCASSVRFEFVFQ